MTKQKASIVLGAAFFLWTAGQSGAGILTIGDYIAEPGDVVTAQVDLSELGDAEFTSMDIALQVLPSVGSGASPNLGFASASTEEGWAWSPFGSVNDAQQTFNATNTVAVYGVAGSPLGVTSTLDGTVLQVPITVPADAVTGDVFVLDLLEANSNVSNNGQALTPMPGWADGSITIIPEPATSLIIALSMLGLGVLCRHF